MDKLFRWTIYLMVFFITAILIYIYSLWSYEPQEKKELAVYSRTYINMVLKNI